MPSLLILFIFGAVLWCIHWFFIGRHPEFGNERKFPFQILVLALVFVSVLAFVIALPISESFRNQIIGLVGILLSGIIAFSSTNIVSNFLAGILLRITKPFRTGEFIRVGDYFGRVSERGLFHTEIQSENRELVALPNTYLANNPVSKTRRSGAIVSTTLSLGYDIHHSRVESLLIKAAGESGLEDPFVHILELGDYSITYRISGLLEDVKGLVTTRSKLCRSVLETLHGQGIEIVSPAFMNQRRIGDDRKVIPTYVPAAPPGETVDAEEIVFDKAEQAEQIESEKQELIEDIKELEAGLKDKQNEEKERAKEIIAEKRERLKAVVQVEISSDTESEDTDTTDSANSKNPEVP
jgi:small-conductance mechanosensitive channel